MENPTRPWELIGSILVLGLGITAWVLSSSFPRTDGGYLGPALFPKILGGILVATSLGLLIPNLRKPGLWQAFEPQTAQRLLPIGVLLGALLFSPWLIAKIGLVFTTVLFSMMVAILLGAKWAETLLLGAIMTGFVYLVFVVLLKV